MHVGTRARGLFYLRDFGGSEESVGGERIAVGNSTGSARVAFLKGPLLLLHERGGGGMRIMRGRMIVLSLVLSFPPCVFLHTSRDYMPCRVAGS